MRAVLIRSTLGSRPTRRGVTRQEFGGSPSRTIRRACSDATRFAGSCNVAHARVQELRHCEAPLQRHEPYDLAGSIRPEIQWVPARTSACRRTGYRRDCVGRGRGNHRLWRMRYGGCLSRDTRAGRLGSRTTIHSLSCARRRGAASRIRGSSCETRIRIERGPLRAQGSGPSRARTLRLDAQLCPLRRESRHVRSFSSSLVRSLGRLYGLARDLEPSLGLLEPLFSGPGTCSGGNDRPAGRVPNSAGSRSANCESAARRCGRSPARNRTGRRLDCLQSYRQVRQSASNCRSKC
jgi:hypothetical protein